MNEENSPNSSRQWYVRKGGKQHGPLTAWQLKKLIATKKLALDDEIRRGDSTQWRTVSSVVKNSKPTETVVAGESPTTGSDAPSGFRFWYRSLWVSKTSGPVQVLIWLFYGFLWIPVAYGFRKRPNGSRGVTKLKLAAAFAVLFVFVVGPIQQAVQEAKTVGETTRRTVNEKNAKPTTGSRPTSDPQKPSGGREAKQILEAMVDVSTESSFDRIQVDRDGNYVLAGSDMLWSVDEGRWVDLPEISTTYQWGRSALSPDGQHLAVIVSRPELNKQIDFYLHLFRLNGTSTEKVREIELRYPRSVKREFLKVYDNFHWKPFDVRWNEDEIVVLSHYHANVISDWDSDTRVDVIAHPDVMSATPSSTKTFYSLINDNRDSFTISDVCVLSSDDAAVCTFKKSGVYRIDLQHNAADEIEFPPCLTEWTYKGVSESSGGDFLAFRLTQDSGRVETGSNRVFHTSRDWTFVCSQESGAVVKAYGPTPECDRNDSDAPVFHGFDNDGGMLLSPNEKPLVIERRDPASGKVITLINSFKHLYTPLEVTLSQDGRYLVAITSDGPMGVARASDGMIASFVSDPALCSKAREIEFADHGSIFIVRYYPNRFAIFDPSAGLPGKFVELSQAIANHDQRTADNGLSQSRVAMPLSSDVVATLRTKSKSLTKLQVEAMAGGKPISEHVQRLENYPDKTVFPRQRIQVFQTEDGRQLVVMYEVGSSTNPFVQSVEVVNR